MPALRGKDFILKVGDGTSAESFTTVAALRATALSINGNTIEVSTKDSFIGNVLWQELLSGGGIRALTLTCDGIYTDDATQRSLADDMLTGVLRNYQLDDGVRVWEGAFQATQFDQDGDHDDSQKFSVTLESSGQITITSP